LLTSLAALAFAHTTQRLSAFDLTLVALYLIGITLFGLRFREKKNGVKADKSLKSYFLANNTIPWWAIALSIVSAETSTLTIISIPGVAFAGDFGFLQLVIGYMLGRIVVALLFLPRYFAGEMLTAYQLIDRRFGSVLHKTTAGLFLLTRAAAEGVRVFAVSIVVAIAIGTGNVLSIAIISGLTLLYTFEGGMAAVIWTDVVQMIIYIGGTVVAIITLGTHVPGGWSAIHTVAAAAGKFHMLNFAFNLTQDYTFWAGVLGGTFLTMASHGTDQLMVQRMLAARNLRQSQLALLSSGVIIFVQFSLFLLIGAGLFVFYGLHPTTFASADRIFPTFIVREMPVGIAGLLVAAILAAAMSNLSAALNSLSSTTVVDFYMHFRPTALDRERAIISKSSTVLWALVLFAIAVYSIKAGGKGHVVEIGLSIAAVAYGCLLGVFLLGTLTKFATETGAAVGMVCGFALNLWLWQGDFPVHLGPITIPHIAFTWYVLIGAFVTFAIGSFTSLIFRKQSKRSVTAFLCFAVVLTAAKAPRIALAQTPASAPDFSTVTALMNDAIADHKLPGAVVIVGHNGKQVFERAYGDRKLAGQPGLNGQPSAAEPMTEDTIFDMASLTKDLATATAVMQLYDEGKIRFDDPVEKYLPAFNPTHDPIRAQVTLRMLLTHFSGEGPDISLKDPWGLAAPDRAEGFRRALSEPLAKAPGAHFRYSDINFILLGDLIETITHEPEFLYVRQHIYEPLHMTDTRYLPIALACGPWSSLPPYSRDALQKPASGTIPCNKPGSWNASLLLPRIAPTAHDDESKSNLSANPNFDDLLRGTVDDPTTRRMGGVAGHAGLFSTAHDVSLFASALLEKLLYNRGPFPVPQSTLKLMMQPEQPGHNDHQVTDAEAAQNAALEAGEHGVEPGLAPHYPSIEGQDLRGYGWDIDTAFSKPRGLIFPVGSFGHTGYTGTTLWMDADSDTYVVLLANAIHPHVGKPISDLRGQVSTAAAEALGLYPKETTIVKKAKADVWGSYASNTVASSPMQQKTLTGIDVLEQTHFDALTQLAQSHNGHLNLGLLTNQTGVDSNGHRTLDLLHSLTQDNIHLTALFSPEHGIFGKQDSTHINAEVDPATGMHVTSLYGSGAASRHPTHEQLKDLDAVVVDIQDAGVHYWTYESAMGYFLEAASIEATEYHHKLNIIILDRPNPIGGVAVQGPIVDANRTSYVAYIPLPVRHGFTLGELARYIVATKHLDTPLIVVSMQHWHRDEFYAQTGLPWINPSPNLRSPEAAILYPALGLVEPTNVSVGRGTAHPFSFFGAGVPSQKPSTSTATGGLTTAHGWVGPTTEWFNAEAVATYLTARHIPGVTFTPTTEHIDDDANHYPYHGQTIQAVHVACTDPVLLNTPELGIEIISALHHLYPTQFHLARAITLIDNQSTMDALDRNEDPRTIAASWQPSLDAFRAARKQFLLYN
jgi:SSS family transporter